MTNPQIYGRLSALAEPTRVRLLRLLEGEELTVGELVRVLQLPQSTVSRHLKQLMNRGWLERRAAGTASLFRMAPLSAETRGLWELVRDEVDTEYAEDSARLQTVVALRTVDSRTFFERVGGGWDALRTQLFGDAYTLAALLALLPEGQTVADLGCGTGAVLEQLLPVAGRVVGVDREQAMLNAARERLGEPPNLELLRGELGDLPLPAASLDAALCMLVLHHVADLPPVFAEAARVLRPGGRFIVLDIDEHDHAEYRDTMGHVHLGFSGARLRALGEAAGLRQLSHRVLPAEPEALGPPLCLSIYSPRSTTSV